MGTGFLDGDISVILLNNSIHGAQPKSGALPMLFGSEKRIEYAGEVFLWDTATCV